MGKKEMRAQTGLVRRGGMWWFRRRIPQDLLQHYAPKKEQVFSLRTSDRAEAVRLARLRAVELDQEYERVRAALAKANRPLTAEEMRRLATLYVTWRLNEDENIRRLGLSDEQFTQNAEQLDADIAVAGEMVARGKTDHGLIAMLDDFLEEQGLVVRTDSNSYKALAYEIAKADVKAMQLMKARDRGEAIDAPEAPDVTALKAPLPSPRVREAFGKFTLEDLAEYWKKQKKPAPKTLIEADSVIRRFKQAAGNVPPAKVERRHVIALRDSLVEQGKAPGTVKKLLGLLSGMFQVAVEDDARFGVNTNPVRDVKVRGVVGEAKARKPFTIDDLNAIFASPVFTDGERPEGGAGEAAYWIPLIGLFTGARLNEIGQLHPDDVKTAEGVTFFRFTNEGEGQKLKRGGKSRKRVPVHPQLVRLGFLRYVEQMKERKESRLFPELRPDSHGHITGRWSRWFNRYLDGVVGIADRGKDFHSFRHTFKLHARSCGIPEDQHDALTGHANASVARAYGSAEGYPLAPLAKAVRRLRYAKLDLSNLRQNQPGL